MVAVTAATIMAVSYLQLRKNLCCGLLLYNVKK